MVENVLKSDKAQNKVQGLRKIPIREQIAHECISLSYGFFTPLQGFMGREDLEGVSKENTLTDGTVWSIPIVFDLSEEELKKYDIKEGESVLLSYQNEPLAIFDIDEIYKYDKKDLARNVYGTSDIKHPGVKRTLDYKDNFIGGKVTLVNEPKFNEPYASFWKTPLQHREMFKQKGWEHIVAHQTRNVPHTGHEWLMKFAWFAANEDLTVDTIKTGVLVNCIIGEKRKGDYIDEAILLTHEVLRTAKYFREDAHAVTFTLWDMRYAGPREALFHAALRTNLGCTHHMFGRDHAGVGSYYGPYDAHYLLKKYKDKLGIKVIFLMENWYCPVCSEVTSSGLCGHKEQSQVFSGTMIRSILMDGVKPTKLVFRPEVFDKVMECSEKYGYGSPFVNDNYLANRKPIFTLDHIEVGKA
ncbi:MAG: sulfate adenylyltransferase [Candidatus Micrarchaeia archaeon]